MASLKLLSMRYLPKRSAHAPGLFQSLDARVKVISTLALLISVSFSRSLWVIASIYLLTLFFAWTSAFPLII